MYHKPIRYDIRLPQWADTRIKEMSEHTGIQEAILLRSIVIERLREMDTTPVESVGMNADATGNQKKNAIRGGRHGGFNHKNK